MEIQRGASDSERADDRGIEEPHEVAAYIAQILRDAGVPCAVASELPNKAVLWRDRIVVGLALTLLTASAWTYLLWLSADMDMDMDGGMDMSGFRMIPSGMGGMMPSHAPWIAMEFAFVFAMWTLMMVAMMTPSVARTILTFARVARSTEAQGTPLVATFWFVAGYFVPWFVFSLLATVVQWALERTNLLDSAMASTSNILGGLIFVAAGSYQWTRAKDACLAQCQEPVRFLVSHGGFRGDAAGCLILGLRRSAYCIGCCWALMALLLVGGVMNMLWIILLALLILLEQVASLSRVITRPAGIVLIASGAWFLGMPSVLVL
jgi:predicted metal-binding membrane protein